MDSPARRPLIGIVGGLASGKSTVAAELAKLGCKVIDADKIAHELLDEEAVRGRIMACFGKAVVDSKGKIDRRKLGDIVFADGQRLAELNEIIHPVVLSRVERLIEQYNGLEDAKAVVLDMPLLAEVGWAQRCDRLIFVDCKPELRAVRAKKMGISDNQLRLREKFQISIDTKAALADNTIDNNAGLSNLARQVADIFSYVVDNE